MQEPLNLSVMRRFMEAQLKYGVRKRKCPQFEVPFFWNIMESDELFSVLSPPDSPTRTSIVVLSLYFSALSANYTVTQSNAPCNTCRPSEVLNSLRFTRIFASLKEIKICGAVASGEPSCLYFVGDCSL